MFKKTKKRCERIKNFGKTTFEDMKEIKIVKELDGESGGITFLALIVALGVCFLIELLPIWLMVIAFTLLILLVLYIILVKHE
jgi:hypothetical protein